MCELARVLIISGQLMNIAAVLTRDLREQGHKSCKASYYYIFMGWTKNWWSCECFLANYVNEGDSWKFSSMNDSQYTVLTKLTSPCQISQQSIIH